MSRIAYVYGRYVPHRSATVHIEDRGYQFGDPVGDGVPSLLSRKLREFYLTHAAADAGGL